MGYVDRQGYVMRGMNEEKSLNRVKPTLDCNARDYDDIVLRASQGYLVNVTHTYSPRERERERECLLNEMTISKKF